MFIVGVSPLFLVCFGIACIIEHCSGKQYSLGELCLTAFGVAMGLLFFGAIVLSCLTVST